MKNVIGILALLAIGACDNGPLTVTTVKDGSVDTKTKTATTSATVTFSTSSVGTDTSTVTESKSSTATATSTTSATSTVSTSETNTDTGSDTVTKTATQTATNTATTTQVVAVPFKIVSVTWYSVDALGNKAADVRSFGIRFNEPAMDVDLTIMALDNGNFGHIVHHEYIAHSPESQYISPGNWTEKLQSDTTYQWVVQANADITVMSGLGSTASVTGTFKTDHFAGEAYFCPVNDSTISQGCCMPDGSFFASPLLSELTHQPNAYILVKGSNSIVYLYATNDKRYVFTSKDVITSWFTSFDGGQLGDLRNVCNTVNELSDVELAGITIGGNVTIRPGSAIVKIASDPTLYVVARGKVLRKLASADLAEKLYPGTSAQRIRVIPDAFFVNYYIGMSVNGVSDYDPASEWATANLETESETM
jgi:hypothetical protein